MVMSSLENGELRQSRYSLHRSSERHPPVEREDPSSTEAFEVTVIEVHKAGNIAEVAAPGRLDSRRLPHEDGIMTFTAALSYSRR